MEKTLIVAEKDSLGAQIAKALGIGKKISDNGVSYYEGEAVIVAMASGHLVQRVPAEKSSEVPYLPHSYRLEPIKTKLKKLTLIKKLADRKDVTEICNACDPGKEGELIGWLIYSYTGSRKRYTRLWADTQTSEAIRKDFAERKPSSEYKNILNAALCRHDADFKLGINSTRCLQQLMNMLNGGGRMHSAGRVRTPTMAKIYDLEQKILNFKPVPYYDLSAKIEVGAGSVLTAIWMHPETDNNEDDPPDDDDLSKENNDLKNKLTERSEAEAVKEKSECQPVEISVLLEEKEQPLNSPDLFDLADLAEAANAEFKWSVEKVVETLQVLYESGLVTYPRSESKFLGDDGWEKTKAVFAYLCKIGFQQASLVIERELVRPDDPVFNTDKLVDGHGGIIPSIPEQGVSFKDFTQEQQDLYRMIANRFIAKFYPPAIFQIQTHIFDVNGEKYKSSSRVCTEKGWRDVSGATASKDNAQPEIIVNPAALNLLSIEILEKKTQPPKRLTLGKVPKMMKRYRLGTAATRIPIVSELSAVSDTKRVRYLAVQNNLVMPTVETGEVIEFLRKHNIGDLTGHDLTARLEEQLEDISKGKMSVREFTDKLDAEVCRIVRQFQEHIATLPEYSKPIGVCPKCHAELIDRGGRTISCNCGFKLWKSLWGVELSDENLRSLVMPPYRTDTVKGFLSTKTKRRFDAQLRLNPENEWKVEPFFEGGLTATVEKKETSYECPHCKMKLFLWVKDDTNKWLQCSSKDHKFLLRLFVAKRKLSGQEVGELLAKGYLSSRTGFVGKKGKPFSAALKMAADGSIEFDFSD